jgi:hypothetical protein
MSQTAAQKPTDAKVTPTPTPTPATAPATAGPTKVQTIKELTPAPFQITPIRQSHRYFKCLFYGAYGTGKTTLACTAADVDGMEDVLMINAESGTMSVEEAEHIVNREYIDQVRVTNFNEVAAIQDFLTGHCAARDDNKVKTLKALQFRAFRHPPDLIVDGAEDDVWEPTDEDIVQDSEKFVRDNPITGQREKLVQARLRRFRTVIVDSVKEIDTFSIYQLLGMKVDMKLDDKALDNVAGWDEFRKNNQKMQLLIRAYRDLKMNVIMVTGAKYTQDEKKIMHWAPDLTGQLAYQIQGFVDVVGYLTNGTPEAETGNIPRRLYVQPVGYFDAKCRISSYRKPHFSNPSMRKIMAAFRNSKSST